jgi:hypothetical protein
MPQNLPPPMHTQTPLPHNLTLNTCSPRRNILKHHSAKIAKTELSRAITDQHTIRTARGRVGRGGSNDLVVLAGCAWGDGLPDYLAEVAEAVEGGAVADEGVRDGAGCGVAVGWRVGDGDAWGGGGGC